MRQLNQSKYKCICIRFRSLLQVLKLLAKEAWLPLTVFLYLHKMAKPSYFSLPPQVLTQIFFCGNFWGSVRIISGAVKSDKNLHLFLNKMNEHHGMGNIFLCSLILTDITTKWLHCASQKFNLIAIPFSQNMSKEFVKMWSTFPSFPSVLKTAYWILNLLNW